VKNGVINELEEIYKQAGDITVCAYFKIDNGIKVYYDFQERIKSSLNGSFDELEVLELLYYLNEQTNG